MKSRWISLLSLVALLMTACGAPEPFSTPPPPEAPKPVSASQIPSSPDPSGDSMETAGTPIFSDNPTPTPEMELMIDRTKTDLAARINLELAQIEVSKAATITWPDASLGCPKKGVVYAQGLVPGYRIVLKAQERLYDFRTDTENLIILCEKDGDELLPFIPLTPGELQDGKPWVPAQ